MTRAPDRRRIRRRAFLTAAGVAVAGLAAAGLWAVVAPSWLGLVAIAIAGAGLAGAAAILHRPGAVPILVYHSVSPDARWLPWAENTSVRPETFRRHLEILRRGGWTVIPTTDLVVARRQGKTIPDRTAVIHFDDGYLDNFLFAAPILREFAMPASFFVSLDFIEPGEALRTGAAAQGPAAWTGYMTAAELRAMDADPLFSIDAHGLDHARVPVSGEVVDRLTAGNWRRHAPLAWANDRANKARWFEADGPPAGLRLNDPVPASDSALSGRWWRDGAPEDEAAYAARVQQALTQTFQGLQTILGRAPAILAWPFDRSCPVSVAAARRAGFVAVTGGTGENRAGEDPTILSRVHVQDRAFGGGPLWLEGLAFRARLHSASGRLVWHVPVALAAMARRRRFGRPGYGAVS